MSKPLGNMYPGVETWNPIAGECYHKCGYCSTHSFLRYPVMKAKYSGPMHLDYKTLDKNLGKDKTWFVVAQSDLFAIEVKNCWISEVLNHCCKFDNTYLFQTKNPERFIDFTQEYPDKSILCTTIETNRKYPQMGKAPSTQQRAYAMSNLIETTHVTVEPIFKFDLNEMVTLIKMANPDIVNIGFDSKRHSLPEPNEKETIELITELRKFTKVKLKSNSIRVIKDKSLYL